MLTDRHQKDKEDVQGKLLLLKYICLDCIREWLAKVLVDDVGFTSEIYFWQQASGYSAWSFGVCLGGKQELVRKYWTKAMAHRKGRRRKKLPRIPLMRRSLACSPPVRPAHTPVPFQIRYETSKASQEIGSDLRPRTSQLRQIYVGLNPRRGSPALS